MAYIFTMVSVGTALLFLSSSTLAERCTGNKAGLFWCLHHAVDRFFDVYHES